MIEYKEEVYTEYRPGKGHFAAWLNRQGQADWALAQVFVSKPWRGPFTARPTVYTCLFQRAVFSLAAKGGFTSGEELPGSMVHDGAPTGTLADALEDSENEALMLKMADELRLMLSLRRIRDYHKCFPSMQGRILGLDFADTLDGGGFILTEKGKRKLDELEKENGAAAPAPDNETDAPAQH